MSEEERLGRMQVGEQGSVGARETLFFLEGKDIVAFRLGAKGVIPRPLVFLCSVS